MSLVAGLQETAYSRFRVLVEVESAHRRHIRWAATRGRPACSARSPGNRDASRARRGIRLHRRSRRDRRGNKLGALLHRRWEMHSTRLLRVEIHAYIIEPCEYGAVMSDWPPGVRLRGGGYYRSRHAAAGKFGTLSLTCKACTVDILHTMVRNQELLLPPHEHRSAVQRVLHGQVRLLELVLHMPESGETGPVHHILLFRCTPVARQEPIPAANYLGVKVGRQLRPVVCEALDSQVPAQV